MALIKGAEQVFYLQSLRKSMLSHPFFLRSRPCSAKSSPQSRFEGATDLPNHRLSRDSFEGPICQIIRHMSAWSRLRSADPSAALTSALTGPMSWLKPGYDNWPPRPEQLLAAITKLWNGDPSLDHPKSVICE